MISKIPLIRLSKSNQLKKQAYSDLAYGFPCNRTMNATERSTWRCLKVTKDLKRLLARSSSCDVRQEPSESVLASIQAHIAKYST